MPTAGSRSPRGELRRLCRSGEGRQYRRRTIRAARGRGLPGQQRRLESLRSSPRQPLVGRLSAAASGRAGHADPRRRRSDRAQHGGQPLGPHGHQLPQCAREAARGQPQGHQRLPRPHRPDQDQLHSPDRVGDRASHRRRRPGDEEHVRARRRRQAAPHREPARQHESRRRQGEARRQPDASRAGDPRLRHPRLQWLPRRLRGDHPQGQHRTS